MHVVYLLFSFIFFILASNEPPMYNPPARGVLGAPAGVIKVEGPADSWSTWLPTTRMHICKI